MKRSFIMQQLNNQCLDIDSYMKKFPSLNRYVKKENHIYNISLASVAYRYPSRAVSNKLFNKDIQADKWMIAVMGSIANFTITPVLSNEEKMTVDNVDKLEFITKIISLENLCEVLGFYRGTPNYSTYKKKVSSALKRLEDNEIITIKEVNVDRKLFTITQIFNEHSEKDDQIRGFSKVDEYVLNRMIGKTEGVERVNKIAVYLVIMRRIYDVKVIYEEEWIGADGKLHRKNPTFEDPVKAVCYESLEVMGGILSMDYRTVKRHVLELEKNKCLAVHKVRWRYKDRNKDKYSTRYIISRYNEAPMMTYYVMNQLAKKEYLEVYELTV